MGNLNYSKKCLTFVLKQESSFKIIIKLLSVAYIAYSKVVIRCHIYGGKHFLIIFIYLLRQKFFLGVIVW